MKQKAESIRLHFHNEKILPHSMVVYFESPEFLFESDKLNDIKFGVISKGYLEDYFKDKKSLMKALNDLII